MLDLKESDKYISQLILSGTPFSVARVGFIEIAALLNPVPHWIRHLDTDAGIYNVNQKWFDLYSNCIRNCDAFAVITGALEREQSVIHHPHKLDFLALEPFYRLQDGVAPWSHALLGKKVLVIHPFVDSFQKQKNFKMFGDHRHVFLEGQEFVFYKSFQTSAGNHLHTSWEETFSIMCQDVQKLDFDIALLGCGGYGLPLVNFIKGLGKSAIYVGGGLQLLFGVMGRRWETSDFWKKHDTSHFIKPSGDEIIQNCQIVEGGCYW